MRGWMELRDILGSQHTSSPPATLDTSVDEPQQALQPESTPEASLAPSGHPPEATPGTSRQEEEEEEAGGSSSAESSLQILLLPSRSSSRASAPRGSPDRGSGPTEGPEESAGEVSVVPESPPGPSLQGSPSAEDQPAPRRARRRTPRLQPPTATDPHLLAIHRRQLEVAEQHLQLQKQALAWRQEAWGAYMETFNCLVDYLAPPCRAGRNIACPACSCSPTTSCSARRRPVRRRPATHQRGPERRGTPGVT
ncbi:uncharacterized protein LOC142005077 [Carettochelys insculpta]|uniref:uncharacterized protein LOC142005077 n=1 Tax=Carettochelys insculpta TaxID=44489 RepID=UPI003EBDBBD1